MARLVTFGCSHTYGHGLDKNNPFSPTEYDRKAWPSRLSNLLNYPLVNLGRNVESNKGISYSVINFPFRKDDLVVILWSYSDRSAVIEDDNTLSRIHIAFEDVKTKSYYTHFHSDLNSSYESLSYINLADIHLKNKGIKFLNCFTNNKLPKFLNKKKFNNISYYKNYFGTYHKFGMAYDNVHIGVEGHKRFANDLYNYLYTWNKKTEQETGLL